MEALKQFRSVATRYGVKEEWMGRVEATIMEHLKAWGEYTEETNVTPWIMEGHEVSNFHIGQQFKGNYCK